MTPEEKLKKCIKVLKQYADRDNWLIQDTSNRWGPDSSWIWIDRTNPIDEAIDVLGEVENDS
jgi:hypothetical protein